MCHQITLNPGYPSEVTTPADAIQVPDLWHTAQAMIDGQLTTSKPVLARAGAEVLEAWHLAHALLRYIRQEAAKMPYGPPLSICSQCLALELDSPSEGTEAPNIGAAYLIATPETCESQGHISPWSEFSPVEV